MKGWNEPAAHKLRTAARRRELEPQRLVPNFLERSPVGDGLAGASAAEAAAQPVHEAAQLVVPQRAAPRAALSHLRWGAGQPNAL